MLSSSFAATAVRRAAIIGAVALASAAFAGCSMLRLAYDQGPLAAYWWLDGYADFEGEQPARVRERIAEWWRWHRATQLADASALLTRAADEVLRDATPAQACGWIGTLTQRVDLYVDRALPALAETATALTPAQIDHVERKLAKNDEAFREDQLEGAPDKVAERRLKKAVERAEQVYGRIGAAQKEQLARNLAASPYDPAVSFAERRLRQRDVVATLRRVGAGGGLGAEQARTEAQALVQRLRQSPRPGWQAYQQRLQTFGCTAGAQFHNVTTAAQRRVASERLAGWAGDLRSLAARPEPRPGAEGG